MSSLFCSSSGLTARHTTATHPGPPDFHSSPSNISSPALTSNPFLTFRIKHSLRLYQVVHKHRSSHFCGANYSSLHHLEDESTMVYHPTSNEHHGELQGLSTSHSLLKMQNVLYNHKSTLSLSLWHRLFTWTLWQPEHDLVAPLLLRAGTVDTGARPAGWPQPFWLAGEGNQGNRGGCVLNTVSGGLLKTQWDKAFNGIENKCSKNVQTSRVDGHQKVAEDDSIWKELWILGYF